jgi:hypothetical protein
MPFYKFLYNLLTVLVQIADKLELQQEESGCSHMYPLIFAWERLDKIITAATNFFLRRPNLFAIFNNTVSKWWENIKVGL